MARTIKQIEAHIALEIGSKLNLSTSAVAEWKLWSTVIATVIYYFEVILDAFKKEIEERTDKAIPGTLRWYASICRKWQYGDTLLYAADTAEVFYKNTDINKQIISALSVVETDGKIVIKVAKTQDGSLVPLSDEEYFYFKTYVGKIKFAGDRISIISTAPDTVTYSVEVYTDGVMFPETLKETIQQALDAYRLSIDFNGTIHIARIISTLLDVEGIITASMTSFSITPRGGIAQDVTTSVDCISGYFDLDHKKSNIYIIDND